MIKLSSIIGILVYANLPVGVNVVTYTATDVNGNSSTISFTITVIDDEVPVVTNCPSDITVNTAVGRCNNEVTWTPPQVNDNCNVTVIASHLSGATFEVGTTTVTYTATDGSGNATLCSFDVTVVDNQLPTIECPADITVCADEPVGTIVAPTGADNCGVLSVAGVRNDGLALNAAYPVGTTTITWTVTDIHSNINSCVQNVMVNPLPVASISNDNGLALSCNIPNTTLTASGGVSYSWSTGATTASHNSYRSRNIYCNGNRSKRMSGNSQCNHHHG